MIPETAYHIVARTTGGTAVERSRVPLYPVRAIRYHVNITF
jgi:hypothetical protein